MNHDQHRMECYDIADWWGHFSNGPCGPCIIRAGEVCTQAELDSRLDAARQDYLRCRALCESEYCLSRCKQTYDAAVADIRQECGVTE